MPPTDRTTLLATRVGDPNPDDTVLAFCTIRNEAWRLPGFFKHYRSLGIERFYFVDNGSTDGTYEILADQDDVVLFETTDSYVESDAGHDWLVVLRDEFGTGRWCLVVDADEHLIFPWSEAVDIVQLVEYFDRQGVDAMFALMLDMYSVSPLADVQFEPGTPPAELWTHFDSDTYFARSVPEFNTVSVYGGPRWRVFFERGRVPKAPMMRKIPLVKWSETTRTTGPHRAEFSHLGQVTGCFLHYKFRPDFARFCAEEFERKDRVIPDHYRRYSEAFAAEPDLSMMYEGSLRYAETAQLVQLGLMRSSKHFLNELYNELRAESGQKKIRPLYETQRAALEASPQAQLSAALHLWEDIAAGH